MTLAEMLRLAEANSHTNPAIYLQAGLWMFGMAFVHQGRVRRRPRLYLIAASLAGATALISLAVIAAGG